jgi:hypothetical protein
MKFYLQASNPRTIHATSEDDDQIAEAMETVFHIWTENAIMIWDGVHVPLGYKYTLSCMIDDILVMLDELLRPGDGTFHVRWPVQEFEVTWDMAWQGDELEIRSEWGTTPGDTRSLLVDRKAIVVSKAEFITEWRQPLLTILHAIRDAGYDESRLRNLANLQRVCDAISKPGILYRNSEDVDINA